MKNIILFFLVLFFLTSCSSLPKPKSYMNTSTPIFILKQPEEKIAHIDFQDFSQKENNVTAIIASKLTQNGYRITTNKKSAFVLIKGSINYLKQNTRKNTRGFMSVGVGFGSGGRRYNDVGFGVSHRIFGDDGWNDFGSNGYKYDGQASLLIRVKNDENFDNYTTNLNFFTEENTHSLNYARTLFSEQIATQIANYLKL